MLKSKKRIQYALITQDKPDEPACWTHQDDMETPIVADDLESLIDQMGEWCDCGRDYVLEHLSADIFTDESNTSEKYQIIRQEIQDSMLSLDDFKELTKLKEACVSEGDEDD